MYAPTIADALDTYTPADDERALSRMLADMNALPDTAMHDDEADAFDAENWPDPFDGVPADTR